jgi:hypothetical protein
MDTKSSVHLDVIGVRIALESSLSSVLECVADTYWSFTAAALSRRGQPRAGP